MTQQTLTPLLETPETDWAWRMPQQQLEQAALYERVALHRAAKPAGRTRTTEPGTA